MISNIKTTVFKSKSIMFSLLLASIALGGCSKEDREEMQQKATETLKLDNEDLFSIEPGDCFNDGDDADMINENDEVEVDGSVPIRECNEPHDNEAYYVYDLPSELSYMEVEAKVPEIEKTCKTEFAKFVGIDYNDSFYELIYLRPNADSWQMGDTEVLCYVYHPHGEKLTQSLRGIKE